MKYYNKNQIISIDLLDEEESKEIVYIKENKGFLGLFKREEGFYKLSDIYGIGNKFIPRQNNCLINKIPDNFFQKENVMFIKPRIIINYSWDEHQIIYFNTNKERNSYFRKHFSDLNLTT